MCSPRKSFILLARCFAIIAMYLVETLGYSWDKVGPEAEHLEHHMSDQLVARIDAFLGYPELSDEAHDSGVAMVAPAVTSVDRQSRR